MASLREQGWLLPRSLDRGEPPSVTPVGTIDADRPASVDDRGLVSLGRWSLDWWIGADDRWHLPAREAAVRQRLVGAAPVVETAVRIPSGDALHRVFGVRGPPFAATAGGSDQYLVVEVENASPVPFALALVVRPFTSDHVTAIDEITVAPTRGGQGRDQAHVVSLDATPALLLPRAPSRAATGSARSGDLAEVVTTGGATGTFAETRDAEGVATAAFLFPVPHTAVLRVVLPLGARRRSPTDPMMAYPQALPDAGQVAHGWALQTRGCPEIEGPDSRLAEGVAACQRRLLLGPDPEGLAASAGRVRALDREGLHDEAATVLASWPERMSGCRLPPPAAVAVLAAGVDPWRLTRDSGLAEALLPELVAALRAVERTPRSLLPRPGAAVGVDAMAVDAVEGMADLLSALGQSASAARVAEITVSFGPMPRVVTPRWSELDDLVRSASPTWSWPEGTTISAPGSCPSSARCSWPSRARPSPCSRPGSGPGTARGWPCATPRHDGAASGSRCAGTATARPCSGSSNSMRA
ncbi:MAG: hypothetical protein WKF43_14915 [Acidimicrobiales bacterium]